MFRRSRVSPPEEAALSSRFKLYDPAADVPIDELEGPAALRWTEFFRQMFKPYLALEKGCNDRNFDTYEESLKHWRSLTSDPPVGATSKDALINFRDGLLKLPGRKGALMSKRTAHKHCRTMRSLIAFAGQPDGCHPDALGILETVPRMRLPKLSRPRAQHVMTLNEWIACLVAAVKMTYPVCMAGVAPVNWWQGILIVTYVTGYRIGTLLDLEWSMLQNGLLTVEDDLCKCEEGDEKQLPAIVLDALSRVKCDDTKIFPWPCGRRYVWQCFDKLMIIAGIPPQRRRYMKFHGIRKRHGADMAKVGSVAAAQLSLNHGEGSTTNSYYLPRNEVTQSIIDQLPGLGEIPAFDNQRRFF